jgi:hypothetical protein
MEHRPDTIENSVLFKDLCEQPVSLERLAASAHGVERWWQPKGVEFSPVAAYRARARVYAPKLDEDQCREAIALDDPLERAGKALNKAVLPTRHVVPAIVLIKLRRCANACQPDGPNSHQQG